ncbi:predicted protein [Mycobacterium tuberculosis T85]|nr:predicted protein [Mycobacterium tuberculosis T85]
MTSTTASPGPGSGTTMFTSFIGFALLSCDHTAHRLIHGCPTYGVASLTMRAGDDAERSDEEERRR